MTHDLSSRWVQNKNEALVGTFKFTTFGEAFSFVTHVALLAERHDHHPDIFIKYTCVTLHLTTHDAGALTNKDFQLAQEIDSMGKMN